jgi:hypothetical protein
METVIFITLVVLLGVVDLFVGDTSPDGRM